jgi:hypothetical protein
MPRKKGSTNSGKLPRNAILKIRVPTQLLEIIHTNLESNTFKKNYTLTEFTIEAIQRHLLFCVKDINILDRNTLEKI